MKAGKDETGERESERITQRETETVKQRKKDRQKETETGKRGGGGGALRERDRDRQTDRQTSDADTDRDRDRERQRHRDRDTEREEGETNRQTEKLWTCVPSSTLTAKICIQSKEKTNELLQKIRRKKGGRIFDNPGIKREDEV